VNIEKTDEGKLVDLTLQPAWGPGKIVKVDGKYVYIRFKSDPEPQARKFGCAENPLQVAASQTDPVLDRMPIGYKPKSSKTAKQPKSLIPLQTFEQAKETFLAKFPGKFDDAGYIGDAEHGERFFLLQSVQLYQELFGNGQLRQLLEAKDAAQLAERAQKVLGAQNLTFVQETLRFKDVLKMPEETLKYFGALAQLLEAEELKAETMTPYFEAVKAIAVVGFDKWPNATLFPFLAQPARHIFLKPQVTKQFAQSLGYDLKYNNKPNWATYEAFLVIAKDCQTRLADWNPKDLIDIQSFIWVLMGYHIER
jgi:hypothetical protein